jgi:Protein of unknown function (DUF4013)
MELGRSFTFPFQDKSWFSKLIIAALISFVPILNFALIGWMVEIAHRVMNREPEELPGWDNFGKKWMGGLYYAVAGFIYSLPVMLVACVMGAISFGSSLALSQNNNNAQNVANAVMAGSGIVGLCLGCLVILYGLVLSVLMPGLLVHYAKEDNFGSLFKLGVVYGKVRENASSFFMAWLVALVFGFVAGLVLGGVGTILSIIPCIGWIAALLISMLAAPYISAVYSHLFGQYGEKAYGTPAPISSAGIPDSLPPAS